MTQYTTEHNIPYPSGEDPVVVHGDIERTAKKVDLELQVVRAEAYRDSFELTQESANRVVDVSTNLFNPDTVLIDHTILPGQATPTPNTTAVVSERIRVAPGQQYTYIGATRATYLDADGQYVDYQALDDTEAVTRIVPQNVTYVRISASKTLYQDTTQMNLGARLLPYERGRAPLIKDVALPELADGAIGPRKTTFFEASTNLIVVDTMIEGYALNRTTGELSANTRWSVTDWIPIEAGESYMTGAQHSVSGHIFVWYTTSRDFIESTTAEANTVYTAPANSGFLRVAVHELDLAVAQVNQGTTPLPYEPGYTPRIKPQYLPAGQPGVNSDRILDTSGLNESYTAPDVDAQPGLDATVTADVYAWYDTLMAEHPDYITRTDLGEVTGGHRMYSYTLTMPPVPHTGQMTVNPALTVDKPVIFITSGVHGYEKAAVYTTWRLAKALCEEWVHDPVIDAIRGNFEVVIIPVGCPYGYDNSPPGVNRRANANGVDIARNFPEGWVLGDPETTTYGGSAPLTEPETIAINAVMENIAGRAVLGLSYHNFSDSPDTPAKMIWQAASSRTTLELGAKLISRVSRKWSAEHSWITAPGPYYGYTNMGAPGGSESRQMEALGFPGSTFETSRLQYLDGGDGERHTTRAMTLSLEALVNYLAMSAHALL